MESLFVKGKIDAQEDDRLTLADIVDDGGIGTSLIIDEDDSISLQNILDYSSNLSKTKLNMLFFMNIVVLHVILYSHCSRQMNLVLPVDCGINR